MMTRARAAMVVVGVLLLVSLAIVLLLPRPAKRRVRPPCMVRLSQLGKCCEMYRIDHGRQNPSSLQDLTPYGNQSRLYVCPSGHKIPGEITNVDAWSDYILVPLPSNAPSDTIQIICMSPGHEGKGANAAYADGSVCWLPSDDFTLAMRMIIDKGSTNKALENIGAGAPNPQR